MVARNAFYAQSGGVTAVINASACAVLETARRHPERISKVFAGRHGIIGALTENLIDTSQESAAAMAAAGASRFVEVGPGKVLQGLVKRTVAAAECAGFDTAADLPGASA